jgi:hypothetical protein
MATAYIHDIICCYRTYLLILDNSMSKGRMSLYKNAFILIVCLKYYISFTNDYALA